MSQAIQKLLLSANPEFLTGIKAIFQNSLILNLNLGNSLKEQIGYQTHIYLFSWFQLRLLQNTGYLSSHFSQADVDPLYFVSKTLRQSPSDVAYFNLSLLHLKEKVAPTLHFSNNLDVSLIGSSKEAKIEKNLDLRPSKQNKITF